MLQNKWLAVGSNNSLKHIWSIHVAFFSFQTFSRWPNHVKDKFPHKSSGPASNLICFLFQAYISCTIGVSWVGYAMICYGITDVIFCYVGGKLNRLVGRVALYTGAFTVQSALVLTLILWSPSPDSLAPFFIIPALWGMCDAVWQPQTTGKSAQLSMKVLALHLFFQ